jgi:hypothetical protein
MSKQKYIEELANALSENNKTLTFEELAENLNEVGYETNDGQDYKGGRGTATLVKTVHEKCEDEDTAENISTVFTGKDGTLPYEKK